MSSAVRRIDIRELGESACKLIREVHDSGEEVVLVDGDEEMAVVTAAISPKHADLPNMDNWHPDDRAAWIRLRELREEVTRSWASELTAAEVIEEQRR